MIAYDRNFSREITLQNEIFETLLKKNLIVKNSAYRGYDIWKLRTVEKGLHKNYK